MNLTARTFTAGCLTAALLALTGTSCRRDTVVTPDTLARVGRQTLSRQQLAKAVPPGLTADDSTKFARAYVRDWIDSRIMGEVAVKNIPDMKEIDRMVDEYRNQLIAWEYRRLMYYEHGDSDLAADSVMSYYERHKDEFRLRHPIVKGVYIKIADDSPSLAQVRKLYRSHETDDIDRLEKKDFSGLIHYDYFRDKWVDWGQIEVRMPYDFGSDPDAFLRGNTTAEITAGGFVYLLEISEYIPSGEVMPFEYAGEFIKDALINEHRLEYDRRLRMDLYNKGLEDGDIEIFCDLGSR